MRCNLCLWVECLLENAKPRRVALHTRPPQGHRLSKIGCAKSARSDEQNEVGLQNLVTEMLPRSKYSSSLMTVLEPSRSLSKQQGPSRPPVFGQQFAG